MSYKVSKYMSTSLEVSGNIIQKQYLKWVMFMLVSFIGKLLFFSFPLFALAEHELAKQAINIKPISIELGFNGPDKPKTYLSTLLFVVYKQLILLVGGALIVLLGYLLLSLSIELYLYVLIRSSVLILISQGIVLFVSILFIIWFSLHQAMTIYLLHANQDIKLGDAMAESQRLLTTEVKIQIMSIRIRHFGRVLLIWIVLGAIGYYARFMLPTHLWIILMTVLGLIAIVTLPKYLLSNRIALNQLFADVISECAYQSLFEQTQTSVLSNQVRKADILVSLFDEVIINPVEPVVETPENVTLEEVTS